MDFKITLKMLVTEFDKNSIDYALAGAFAMGALGVARATSDIDFLILASDTSKVADIMTGLGYKQTFSGENVSQYVSGIKTYGEIDFIHALRPLSIKMLENARLIPVFGGELEAKVLRHEDLIALKIQALSNDDTRKNKDMSDIEAILEIHGKNTNWSLLKEYFDLFEMKDDFIRLKNLYGKP